MENAAETPAYHDIPRAQLVREGVVRAVAGDVEILAAETRDGVRVYSGICPHLGGPLLEGAVRDGLVRCPWHAYEFDLATAACRTVPGRPWRTLVAREVQGEPFRGRLVPLRFELSEEHVRVFLPPS